MASPATINGYGSFIEKLLTSQIDSLQSTATTVRCALMDENLVFSHEDEYWSDVAIHEVEGDADYDPNGNYAPQDLINKQVVYDPIGEPNTIYFQADNISYGDEVTITARYLVVYIVESTPETSPLLLFVDLGEMKSSLDGRFEVNWHADGLFYISF